MSSENNASLPECVRVCALKKFPGHRRLVFLLLML